MRKRTENSNQSQSGAISRNQTHPRMTMRKRTENRSNSSPATRSVAKSTSIWGMTARYLNTLRKMSSAITAFRFCTYSSQARHRCSVTQSAAISGHDQRSSRAVISAHQGQSSALIQGSHQRSSRAVMSGPLCTCCSSHMSGHQRSSEAIRGHQRPSEVIRGHQRPSHLLQLPHERHDVHILLLSRARP